MGYTYAYDLNQFKIILYLCKYLNYKKYPSNYIKVVKTLRSTTNLSYEKVFYPFRTVFDC